LLLIGFAIHTLVACSVPEAAAPAHHEAIANGRDAPREQSAVERRRVRVQRQILSELRELKESRDNAAAGATEPARARSAEPGAYRLLVFGGASHEVYLGCMCEGQDAESVFNLTGEFGSASSGNSMRNESGPYGSQRADTSPCNPSATRPPSIVASDGRALGLLTLNPSLKKRIVSPAVVGWLARMCRR
jgi:hypothetical protein